MAKGYSRSSEEINAYVQNVFKPEDDVLREIRERGERSGLPSIQVGAMDALHLEVLVRATGAKKIVEIGTLAGYSGVSLARGLAEGGRLFTFEYEPRHADVARESFHKAGLSERVEIHVGPAIENLAKIESQGPFDLVFIDADKESYPAYYEWAVKNLRRGGVILADNTFSGGTITDAGAEASPRTKALRKFNQLAASDARVRATILPTSDGLTFAVKL